MAGEATIAAVVVGGLLGVVGIAAVASSSSSSIPTPAAPPTPPSPAPTPGKTAAPCANTIPAGYTWEPLTGAQAMIQPGEHVRISMEPAAFNTFSNAIANLGTGITGWTNLLSLPQVSAVLGTSNICAWAPGDALPLDWPAADVDEAAEYHADFVYQGAVPLLVASLPITAAVWVAQPPDAAGGAGPAPAPGGTSGGGHIIPKKGPVVGTGIGGIILKPKPPGKLPAPPTPQPPTPPNQTTIQITGTGSMLAPQVGPAGSVVTIKPPVSSYITGNAIVDGIDSSTNGGGLVDALSSITPAWLADVVVTTRDAGTILVPWTDSGTGQSFVATINYGKAPSSFQYQNVSLPYAGGTVSVTGAGIPGTPISMIPPNMQIGGAEGPPQTILSASVDGGQEIDFPGAAPGAPVTVTTENWSGRIDATWVDTGGDYQYATILYGE